MDDTATATATAFDEFYTETDSAPRTLDDPQPARSRGGDGQGGGDYSGARESMDAAEGPTEDTACKGAISAPRYVSKEDRNMVIYDFTVFEPKQFAGYTCALFCTTKGGKPGEAQRGLRDVKAVSRALGCKVAPVLADTLAAQAKVCEKRVDVPFTLKPRSNGGHFVNGIGAGGE